MVNLQQNTAFQEFLQSHGFEYQKTAETSLRKTSKMEVGQSHTTFVKNDSGEISIETSKDAIEPGDAIARNPGPIAEIDGQSIYNEWVIPNETLKKNYGSDIEEKLSSSSFSEHRKVNTIKAVEVTPEVMEILGAKADSVTFEVPWSSDGMTAQVGDYIADAGYSISKGDMGRTYEKVADSISETMDINQSKAQEFKKRAQGQSHNLDPGFSA